MSAHFAKIQSSLSSAYTEFWSSSLYSLFSGGFDAAKGGYNFFDGFARVLEGFEDLDIGSDTERLEGRPTTRIPHLPLSAERLGSELC